MISKSIISEVRVAGSGNAHNKYTTIYIHKQAEAIVEVRNIEAGLDSHR